MPFGHGQMIDGGRIRSFPQFGGNRIDSPSSSDTITAGETFVIRWSNITRSPGNMISLFLEDATNATETIQLQRVMQIAFTENNGIYEWNVPTNIPPGDSYIIETQFDFRPFSFSYSEKFTIAGNGQTLPTAPVQFESRGPSKEIIIAGVLVGVGILVIGVLGSWFFVRMRRKRAAIEEKLETESL